MSIYTIYKNINLELDKIFPNELVKIIYGYYCYEGEYNPISTYDTVLSCVSSLGHDGYDYFGPENELHDLYILYKLNGIKYVVLWHRENWFNNSDEDYLYYIQSLMTLNEFIKSNNKKFIMAEFNKFFTTH